MPRLSDLPPSHIADMHYVYGFCNGNARSAVEEYRRRYPSRPVLGYRSFIAVHRHFAENGLQQRRRESIPLLSVDAEDAVLDMIARDPTTSVRRISIRLDIPRLTVWRILKKERLHPYHFRRAQHLLPIDGRARSIFCSWILRKQRHNPEFLQKILWTDEATFTRAGITNYRNMHTWATENPHAVRVTAFQTQFSANIWAGIINDQIVGPFELPSRLTQESFLNFLQDSLPELLESIPLATRRGHWFQLDGAPAHFARMVRDYLQQNYPRWIGRGGTVAWPPRSPDLTPLDFYFWGYMKQKVYAVEIQSREHLIQRIHEAATEIKLDVSQVKRSTQSVSLRALACLQANGGHFENVIN